MGDKRKTERILSMFGMVWVAFWDELGAVQKKTKSRSVKRWLVLIFFVCKCNGRVRLFSLPHLLMFDEAAV